MLERLPTELRLTVAEPLSLFCAEVDAKADGLPELDRDTAGERDAEVDDDTEEVIVITALNDEVVETDPETLEQALSLKIAEKVVTLEAVVEGEFDNETVAEYEETPVTVANAL